MGEKILMQDRRFSSQAARIVAWSVIALLAAALYLKATASGIGLPSDSFFYLGGTEGILAGEGFARPAADGIWKVITHFPPLYSAILVIPSLFFPGAAAAKILNLILFAGNTVLGGLLIKRVTGMSWPGWLMSLAWMLSPVLIEQHISALSEALFLTIILLILFAFQAYLENGKLRALLAAGLFCSLAYLTRYAGAAMILPGILLPFFAKGERIKVRIFETLLFLASGVIPSLVWAGTKLNSYRLFIKPGARLASDIQYPCFPCCRHDEKLADPIGSTWKNRSRIDVGLPARDRGFARDCSKMLFSEKGNSLGVPASLYRAPRGRDCCLPDFVGCLDLSIRCEHATR